MRTPLVAAATARYPSLQDMPVFVTGGASGIEAAPAWARLARDGLLAFADAQPPHATAVRGAATSPAHRPG